MIAGYTSFFGKIFHKPELHNKLTFNNTNVKNLIKSKLTFFKKRESVLKYCNTEQNDKIKKNAHNKINKNICLNKSVKSL
jgi:hypothetical protein